ncbi:MAG TPA: hypothetical protein DCW53_03085 [Rikenellaceae bacterium]|nr:hypothetical protein [Rikenellaceae bacterium]
MTALWEFFLVCNLWAEKDALLLVSSFVAMCDLSYPFYCEQSALAPLRGFLEQREKPFEFRI